MSSSPTSSVISIVTISADDTAAHGQDVVHLGDLAEAMARFPTPEPGHISPDSTQTHYHSLDRMTGIRDESHRPEGVEGVGVKVLRPYCQTRSVGTAGGPHDHLLPARRQ